ncbi:hypothetical protein PC123_g3988 [Phytophthora cactorum]|nr:hypothetical protein PC123_g3988 [Phytophthora cactorum]
MTSFWFSPRALRACLSCSSRPCLSFIPKTRTRTLDPTNTQDAPVDHYMHSAQNTPARCDTRTKDLIRRFRRRLDLLQHSRRDSPASMVHGMRQIQVAS